MQDLKLSLVQADLLWENIPGNLELISTLVDSIPSETDIVILPEMFSTGFSMDPARFAAKNKSLGIPFMKELAEKHEVAVCGSLILEDDGDFFNRLLFVTKSGEFVSYDKRHLFTFVGEEKHYSAGGEKLVIEFQGWRICPMVCYDLRFPVWSRNRLLEGDLEYDFLFYVANWPERRRLAWRSLLRARAIENLAFVAGVNRIGEDGNGISHSGDSALYDPLGSCLGEYTHQQGVFNFLLSGTDLQECRERFGFWRDGDRFSYSDASSVFVKLN